MGLMRQDVQITKKKIEAIDLEMQSGLNKLHVMMAAGGLQGATNLLEKKFNINSLKCKDRQDEHPDAMAGLSGMLDTNDYGGGVKPQSQMRMPIKARFNQQIPTSEEQANELISQVEAAKTRIFPNQVNNCSLTLNQILLVMV